MADDHGTCGICWKIITADDDWENCEAEGLGPCHDSCFMEWMDENDDENEDI